jgi:formylmethanofuran dehydrogenase subunit C
LTVEVRRRSLVWHYTTWQRPMSEVRSDQRSLNREGRDEDDGVVQVSGAASRECGTSVVYGPVVYNLNNSAAERQMAIGQVLISDRSGAK